MKLTFLGTSAANAFPEAFCSCENCQEARFLAGPSLRKRSAALINEDLLIDLGPDIMTASQMHQCPLVKVAYCLQTHPHADHLDLSHLLSRSPAFGVVAAPVLQLFASAETLQRASQSFERDMADFGLFSARAETELNLRLRVIEPYQHFSFAHYQVIAFPANHAAGMGALLYALTAEGKSLLYATDTASLFEEVWEAFHHFKLCFDAVVLDHTYGPDQAGSDHLSAKQVIEQLSRMRNEGLLSESARAFATHIAHEGNPAHPKLSQFASQHGYEIAYDGLSVRI